MVRLRTLRLSLTTLALIGARPALAGPINLTGFVETDFNAADPNVRVIDVAKSYTSVGQRDWMNNQGLISGWAIKDLRTAYDPATDTLAVGVNTFMNSQGKLAIVGDVDGNGNPGTASAATTKDGGVDYPNLGGHESVAIGFASDGPNGSVSPGKTIFVAGVPALKTGPDTGAPAFTVAKATGASLGYNFGETMTDHLGSLAFSPSADHPGFEVRSRISRQQDRGHRPAATTSGSRPTRGRPTTWSWARPGLKLAKTRVRAFSEQNIPEPATILAWSVVLGGAVIRFRLRRLPSIGA
ncbi:MAG: hypothetical protein U0794_14030 [Isosphaeraceae bacterium]